MYWPYTTGILLEVLPLLLPGWRAGRHLQRQFLPMHLLYGFLSGWLLIRTCTSVLDSSLTKYPLLLPPPSATKSQEQIHRLLLTLPVSRSTRLLQFSPQFTIVLCDFNVHCDCPQNSTTARAMDLLFQFTLTQSVARVSLEKWHILDWLVHRSDDNIVWSTSVTSAVASDHLCVISHFSISVPGPPPSFVMACVHPCHWPHSLTCKTVSLVSSRFLLRTFTFTCDIVWTSILQPRDRKSLLAWVPLGSQPLGRKLGLLSNKVDVHRDSGLKPDSQSTNRLRAVPRNALQN